MRIVIALLLALGIPYLGLLLLVVAGMLRRDRPPPARWAEPPRWPSVSVVLPAHDEEYRLPATLASLAAQRYPGEHEFIVVDDRSTDATAALARRVAARDERFKVERVTEPSRRAAPKVNAVLHGILRSRGELIVTTDADCRHGPDWLEGLARAFTPGVVMVTGYVEAEAEGPARFVDAFEGADWFSLMLTSRSLLRFGMAFASSANNQAYLRSAFRAAGGFGAAARAPSGDEDLLVQRLGRLPGARVAFACAPSVRVTTRTMGTWRAFLRQRRRWVSRYQHLVQYHPGFVAGLGVLGLESVVLVCALAAAPFVPRLAPWALSLYAAQTVVHVTGMWIGARQLGRPRFGGPLALLWALLHPLYIAFVVVASLVKPAAWRAGALHYRRRFLRTYLRLLRRWLLARA